MSNVIAIGSIGVGENPITQANLAEKLANADQTKDLYLDFHSDGGSVIEGFGMYQLLADYPGKVIARIKSAAFSIASYLVAACDEIEIAENGWLMIHNPYSSFEGDDEQLIKHGEFLAKLKNSMIEVYSARTGKAKDEIKSLMKAETFISASEAIDMGFADRIIPTVVAKKNFPNARMPQVVFASLYGLKDDDPGKKEPIMSDSQKTPATIKQLKSNFPKASNDFVVKCMEQEMTLEDAQAAHAKAMEEELEAAKATIKAMEEEKEAAAKAMEEEEEAAAKAKAEEEKELAKAQAKTGVQPVATAATPTSKVYDSARQEWNGLVDELAKTMTRQQAALAANRKNPELRSRLLAEANGN